MNYFIVSIFMTVCLADEKIKNRPSFSFFYKGAGAKKFMIVNGDNLRRISELQCIYFYCRFVIYFLFAIWRG